jgi:hypothetical protein
MILGFPAVLLLFSTGGLALGFAGLQRSSLMA